MSFGCVRTFGHNLGWRATGFSVVLLAAALVAAGCSGAAPPAASGDTTPAPCGSTTCPHRYVCTHQKTCVPAGARLGEYCAYQFCAVGLTCGPGTICIPKH